MIVFAILLLLSLTFNLTAYVKTAPFFNFETGTWSSGDDDSPKTKGMLLIGSNGTVYGEVVLDDNVTVPSN